MSRTATNAPVTWSNKKLSRITPWSTVIAAKPNAAGAGSVLRTAIGTTSATPSTIVSTRLSSPVSTSADSTTIATASRTAVAVSTRSGSISFTRVRS